MRRLLFLVAAMMACPAVAGAPRELLELSAGPASLRSDKSYILFRVPKDAGVTTFEPLFLRVPTEAEMKRFESDREVAFQATLPKLTTERDRLLARKARAEAEGKRFTTAIPPPPSIGTFSFAWKGVQNLQNIESGRSFTSGPSGKTYLIEAQPGTYVLYGLSFAAGWPGLHLCFCFGTVSFDAAPGQIADIGSFLADGARNRSKIPELVTESGFGPSSDAGAMSLLTGTLRPARAGEAIPHGLPASAIVPARFRAVGRFFHPGAIAVNRLGPIPGVLAYDHGRVVDVASGQAVPDNF